MLSPKLFITPFAKLYHTKHLSLKINLGKITDDMAVDVELLTLYIQLAVETPWSAANNCF